MSIKQIFEWSLLKFIFVIILTLQQKSLLKMSRNEAINKLIENLQIFVRILKYMFIYNLNDI
jgi:hypothetical protein